MSWTAVLLAGSRRGDPFAARFSVALKAMIPLAGEPMFVRPLRALLDSPEIGGVMVMAQETAPLQQAAPRDQRIAFRASGGTIAETMTALVEDPGTPWPLLVTTADHALLSPTMIADFLDRAGNADVAVGVVEGRDLLQRFPDAKRTWLRFRGGRYSGANLFALRGPAAGRAIAAWRGVERDRKRGLRVLAALGPALFLGAVLRARTIHQTAAALGRKLGMTLAVVELSDPLAAIDVDKPADHDLVTRILDQRG